jgi:molecular chaperone DnaK
MAKDNKSLGNFRLDGIPMAPRGVPQIEVTFDIDANGILNVTAKDRGSGKEQNVTITSGSGLSDAEIEQLKKDAEAHAADDRSLKEKAEARNGLDNMIYQVGKQLSDLGDKIGEEDRKSVQAAQDSAKKVLENQESSAESMNGARDELSKAMQAAAQKIYAQAQPADAAGPGGAQGQPGPDQAADAAGPGAGKNVVDADFEVVDGDKK